jgi:hypothetical protein
VVGAVASVAAVQLQRFNAVTEQYFPAGHYNIFVLACAACAPDAPVLGSDEIGDQLVGQG